MANHNTLNPCSVQEKTKDLNKDIIKYIDILSGNTVGWFTAYTWEREKHTHINHFNPILC